MAVLDHVAEGLVRDAPVVEMKKEGRAAIRNPDVVDRLGVIAQPVGQSDRLQHVPGGKGDRRDPAVETGVELARGIVAVDHHGLDPAVVERRREGQPHHAAADDDHVAFDHALTPPKSIPLSYLSRPRRASSISVPSARTPLKL